MTIRYLDVCAGISASTVAWAPLGWKAAAYSEIEAAPRAVLAHHYPETPLHGDFTTIRGDEYGPIDLLVGGTPCQDFSVAGLRAGLDGDRGNLSLEFLRLADRTRPRWVVWENVPGVLSIDGGRAFGAILGGLGELGYGFAYRVLDAQFFGVPQRRRRVFVVGRAGDWRGAAAVFSERHSLSGYPAPRREAGARAPVGALAGTSPGGGWRIGADEAAGGQLIAADVAATLPAGGNSTGGDRYPGTSAETAATMLVAFDTTQITSAANFSNPKPGDPCHPLARGQHAPAIAFAIQERALSENLAAGPQGAGFQADIAYTLEARHHTQSVATSSVRRLTPRECERLQGFPDDYTLVPHRGKPMADGPRYKALGNSMAVPVMRWIGERIAAVDALTNTTLAA
ncbi:DNA cytosine methyltransferase [Sphingomonas citri]|nr:DNA cytosine methyltransferase [Sphingomonas citri]